MINQWYIDSLVQDRSIASALAMEILQSRAKLSISGLAPDFFMQCRAGGHCWHYHTGTQSYFSSRPNSCEVTYRQKTMARYFRTSCSTLNKLIWCHIDSRGNIRHSLTQIYTPPIPALRVIAVKCYMFCTLCYYVYCNESLANTWYYISTYIWTQAM